MVQKVSIPNVDITVNDKGQPLLDKLGQMSQNEQSLAAAFNNQIDEAQTAQQHAQTAASYNELPIASLDSIFAGHGCVNIKPTVENQFSFSSSPNTIILKANRYRIGDVVIDLPQINVVLPEASNSASLLYRRDRLAINHAGDIIVMAGTADGVLPSLSDLGWAYQGYGLWKKGTSYAIQMENGIQRRNKGAFMMRSGFDGTVNYAGAAVKGNNYGLLDGATTAADSFIGQNGGAKGQLIGHVSGYAYDEIVNSDVLGCFMSADKKSPNDLVLEYWKDAIQAKVRSYEGAPYLYTSSNGTTVQFTVSSAATYNSANSGGTTEVFVSDSLDTNYYFNGLKTDKWIALGDNGQFMSITRVSKFSNFFFRAYSNSGTPKAYFYGSGDVAAEFNSKFPIGTQVTVMAQASVPYYQSELTWTEIVSNLDVLVATFGFGIAGSWNNGVLNNTAIFRKMNRKAISYSGRLFTHDNGVTWNYDSAASVSPVNNSNGYMGSHAANTLILVQYKTIADFTTSADCTSFTSQINGWTGNRHHHEHDGAFIVQSLISKIPTADGTPYAYNFMFNSYGSRAGEKFDVGRPALEHNPLKLIQQNSPAVKLAYYASVRGEKQTVQMAFKELVFDVDASLAITVNTNTAYSYEAGKVYKLSHVDFRSLEGSYWYFKQATTNTASQIADSLSQAQDEIVTSSLAEKWHGNGYIDNKKLETTPYVKSITDLKGNSVLHGTKEFSSYHWSIK